jgi:sporulation protein YunB
VYSRLLLFLSIFIIIGTFSYEYLDKKVMPTLLAMAEMKVVTKATQVINEAVKEVLSENVLSADDLVTYYYNDNGEIISVGVNTIMINKLSSDIVEKIANDLEAIGIEKIYIPLGNIIGSNVLANAGPEVGIEILPIGTTKINYDREFRSTGINQINHRVWLNIDTTLQVVVPLATDKITISQEFTLVDRVINGNIPDNFIQVPEQNVLDVIPKPSGEK